MKQKQLAAIAIACGLVVGLYFLSKKNTSDPKLEFWVANDPVREGKVIDPEWFKKHFQKLEISKSEFDLPECPYNKDRGWTNRLGRDPGDDLETFMKEKWGKYIIAHNLKAGEVLSKDYLIDRAQGGLAAIIRPGFTALAIPVDASGAVAGWLIPTVSWVKVLSNRRTAGTSKFSKILMKNIRVLAVDQDSGSSQAAGDGAAAKVPSTVTLEVTDEEANVIRQAIDENGKVTLNLIGAKELENLSEDERYEPKNRKGDLADSRPKKASIDELIRPGYVTYTLKLNNDTSSGLILPNNRVKVFGIRRVPGTDLRQAYLVMKNIVILAVDDLTGLDREGERAILGRTITLELTEDEVRRMSEAVEAASQLGQPLSVTVIPSREIKNKTEEQLDSVTARRGDAPLTQEDKPKTMTPTGEYKAPRMAIFISSSGSRTYQANDQGQLQESGVGGGYNPVPAPPQPAAQAPAAPAPAAPQQPAQQQLPPGSLIMTPVGPPSSK